MAESNADLERSLEGPVKELLSRGLSGARPRKSARAFATETAIRRRTSFMAWRRIAAALVLTCTVVALLRVPAVSRAFASVPLLGEAYTAFLKQVNLDAAYQAGLLQRLDRTVTKDGLTLTVIDAGVDGDETVVSYRASPSGEASREASGESSADLWERVKRNEIGLSVSLEGHGSTYSIKTPVMEDNTIYGVVRAERPKGLRGLLWNLLGSQVTFTLQAYELEPLYEPPFDQDGWKAGRALNTWELEIPVRTVKVKPTVIPINKELTAGISLERLVLTPWRTSLEYTVHKAEAEDPTNRLSWQALESCFSLTMAGGSRVRLLGGWAPEDWDMRETLRGEVHFEPVSEGNLSIEFKTPRFEPETLTLPLEENAAVPCFGGDGILKIDSIRKLEGGLEITLRLESPLRLCHAGVGLVDRQGRSVVPGPYLNYGRDNTVTSPFVTDLDSGPYHLKVFELVASEPEGTVVFEVKVPR